MVLNLSAGGVSQREAYPYPRVPVGKRVRCACPPLYVKLSVSSGLSCSFFVLFFGSKRGSVGNSKKADHVGFGMMIPVAVCLVVLQE